MKCPGSVALSRNVAAPVASEAALEGTRAHALAELALTSGRNTLDYVGEIVEGVAITAEMAEAVDVYVDYCRVLMGGDIRYWVEQHFSLESLDPPTPMFGTSDFVSFDPYSNTLSVVDLKFGRGVVVEPENNPQLKFYALGSAIALQPLEIEEISLVIVQPRVAHPNGPVRQDTITYAELMEFAGELLAAAEATTKPNAPLVPGEQCRWCKAAGICPAQQKSVELASQMEFTAIEPLRPAPPETLTDAQLARVMELMPMFEAWTSAVKRHAEGKLIRGDGLDGWKLVAKRANRKWIDEKAAINWLDQGFTEEEYLVDPKLKSPAQIEKLLGRKNFDQTLVEKKSSGYVMVPESDPRPALALDAAAEFTALTSGEIVED